MAAAADTRTGPWAPLRLVLIAFWCGMTWTVGYVVAPTLFQVLDNRALAGNIAGTLFHFQAIASLLLSGVVIWLSRLAPGPRDSDVRPLHRQRDVGLVAAMALMSVVGYYALQPLMHLARHAMAEDDVAAQARFAALHAASALMYLAQSLLGLWLLVRQVPRSEPRSASVSPPSAIS
jgi:hypothetical protein